MINVDETSEFNISQNIMFEADYLGQVYEKLIMIFGDHDTT